jgi:DNA repair exonuclease SbcCD ATPase subunit
MSDLYLRSVEFSNFRIYGDSYAFEFPDGPGITLISGANGLGKTSFFDGVEWALTDQVSRFQDIPVDGRRKEPDPLTRIGAPENSHRVSLQFSDGAPIDRGAGFVPDEAKIAQVLKRPEWTEITNLHGYLSITHFLGQASTQRFSLRKPDKHWEALKGPAGVDRINALRERMSGLGVRRAFTRAIEERTKRLEEASDALANWMSLLAERDRARQLSSSDEAVSPPALREAVEVLGSQLLRLVPDLSWTMPDPSTAAETLLEDFAGLLRAVEQRNTFDAKAADALGEIASAFDVAAAETVTLRSMAGHIEQRRAVAIEKLAEAEAALAQASTGLTATERHAAQAEAGLVTLTRLRAAIRELEQSKAAHAEAKTKLERSAAESGKVQAGIDALRQELANAIRQRADRRGLAERLTHARRRAEVSVKLTVTRAEIDRLVPLLAMREPAELRTRRAELAAREVSSQLLISRITADLRAQDDRLQAIAQAVATIAHRLNHDDTRCPVCASEFAPGRLTELANQQVATDARPVTALATALADARVESEELRRQIAEVERGIVELDQLQATMTTLRAREHELRQQLVEAGGSADGVYDESEAMLLEQELAAVDEQLAAAEAPEQLAARIEEAEAVLKAETAKRITLQRARDTAEEDVEAARAALRQHSGLWNEEKGLLVNLDIEQQRSERNLSDLAARIAAERTAVDDVRLTRDAHRETAAHETEAQATSNARLDALAARRAALVRRWEDAGQSGDPDLARVAQHRARVAERTAQIEPIRASQQRLVAGYRKWQTDERLRRLESQIATVVQSENAASEIEVRRLLEKRAKEARKELEFAQAARERIDRVGSQMQKRAESYADEVLVPLNATIQRFARTLMTWSDASIIYRAEHHVTRSELRPGIVRSGADGSSTHLEMNPNLYFSEGQLSALSVAALLAASTTFGWSRWRGLLLDDPLQHNDVIHASAFMDLLRQMVRELGYQVILSTHDSSEAEFFARKCRSAGIAYHVHELVPQGQAGLVSNVA